MKINHILKDRNYESPESTLKVKYIVNYGKNKAQKRIQINPLLYKINSFIPKKKFKINVLRKEQFNSFSNENMDFFRLDHLYESDRDNYHNKFMDNIQPVNRSSNFIHFNEVAKNIKYLDYLKQNYILNQNKIINRNIYSERDLEIAKKRENYYTKKSQSLEDKIISEENNNKSISENDNIKNNYQNNINTINIDKNPYKRELPKSHSAIAIVGKNINCICENDINNNLNENKNTPQKYSNSYLSNINDYSIQEGDTNFYEKSTKLKLYPTFLNNNTNIEKIRRLYNQDNYKNLINNNPFYKAYNENSKNIGFLRRNGDFSNFEKLYKNHFFFRSDNNKNIYNNGINRNIHNYNSFSDRNYQRIYE